MLVPAQSSSAVATVTAMLTLRTSPDGKAKVKKIAVALKKPSIKSNFLSKAIMPSLSSRRLDATTVAAAASATDQNTPGPAEHATPPPAPVSSVVCDPAVSKRKTEAEIRQVLANKKRAPSSDVKGEEEARLKAAARLKTEEEAKLKSEDVLKFEEEARLKAHEDVRLNSEEEARLKAEEQAKLKAEEEARRKAEEVGRLKEARPKGEEEEERSHMQQRDKPPPPSRISPNKASKVLRKVGKKKLVISDGGVRLPRGRWVSFNPFGW
jgi:hypothetical protein